jgi:phosphatidylinositol phosphate synthase
VKLITKPVEQVFYTLTRPLVDALIRTRIPPNAITVVGTGLVLWSAWAFAAGQIRLGGALYLVSGIVDTFDGAVARANQRVTKFGAFFDSSLDRLGDGATFMGIAVYYLLAPAGTVAWQAPATILCMVAIIASLLVSYTRARAEGLGIDTRSVGMVQRAERILLVGIPAVVVGAGPKGQVLFWIVAILALTSVITVVQRFVYVYQVTEGADAPGSGKGQS